jgi:hypothetical protein
MVLSESAKRIKNEKRVKQRAEARNARLTTPRVGAREELVAKCVSSAIKAVVQKAKARARSRAWIEDNRERKRKSDADYYDRVATGDHVPQKKERYDKAARCRERRQNDEMYLMTSRLRTRLGEFLRLKNGTKAAGTMELVGCTKQMLLNHLKKQLPSGETLQENSIDHIFPMSAYNLLDPAQQKQCMHFSNLRPMKLYGIGGNVSIGTQLPTLSEAKAVARWAWPPNINESDLKH